MKPEQIVVSLEGMDREKALLIAWALSSKVWGFKVSDLLLSDGFEMLRSLKCLGRVFVDLNLVGSTKTITNILTKMPEVDIVSVHALAGKKVLKAAMESVGSIVVANVEADEQVCLRSKDEVVWDLAHMAYDAGVQGVVCPPEQVGLLRHLNFMKIVPGTKVDANLYIVGESDTGLENICRR